MGARLPKRLDIREHKIFFPQNGLWYQYSCMNFTDMILPRNFFSLLMQGAECLVKCEYYPDVHDNKRYNLGVLLRHCASQWNPRDMFINWNCIVLLQII